MKLEIKKIRLNELESFIQSKPFQEFEVIPITPQRAASYLNNPNAKDADVVLYLGFIERRLVAFRTIFAGITNPALQSIRFGWCSGNWVHPDFRRKGFSEQLLIEAISDWDGKLMFTNYAPNSEKLYLKTGKFHEIHKFNGFRGYLFPKTRKLISLSNKNLIFRLLFSIIDLLILIVSTTRLWFFQVKLNSKIRFEIIPFPDEYCLKKMDENDIDFLFSHGKKELNWILNFPWIIKNDNSKSENYPFSSWSTSFKYYSVKIYVENQPTGFILFSVREGHLKTLLMNFPADYKKFIAGFLKQFCKKNKIEVITVYNSGLADQLFKRKFPFLLAKKYGQKIYSSFEITKENKFRFQDGDGDVIFT